MNRTPTRVFVYGTLLPGERNHHYLARCERVETARTLPEFELVDMGTYPALVRGGAQSVPGEVYLVDAEALGWLDRLEECPEFYVREAVALLDAERAEAYLLPAREVPAGAARIPLGDWRAWSQEHVKLRLTRREDLEARWRWEPIPGCPGRSVLRGAPRALTPHDVLGQATLVRAFRVEAAPDEVLVAQLPDGGLISFRRDDGSHVHTLNTPEGFARKLAQLGIAL